jgi:hypothetical protein
MQRFSSLLAGAALSLALLAGLAPSQAAPFRPAPAVITNDAPAAGIEFVRDRHWRHGFRGHHGLRFGLGIGFGGLGFGAPFVGYPYGYDYYPSYAYRRPGCPYGSFYEPGYGCVVDDGYVRYDYDRYDGPAYYDRYPINRDGYHGGGGMPLDYRENQN